MKLSQDYVLLKRSSECFIANIEDGDVFQINDVVVCILENCSRYSSLEPLSDFVFDSFSQYDEGYEKTELLSFLHELLDTGIITTG